MPLPKGYTDPTKYNGISVIHIPTYPVSRQARPDIPSQPDLQPRLTAEYDQRQVRRGVGLSQA
jgi:hypothetical protein